MIQALCRYFETLEKTFLLCIQGRREKCPFKLRSWVENRPGHFVQLPSLFQISPPLPFSIGLPQNWPPKKGPLTLLLFSRLKPRHFLTFFPNGYGTPTLWTRFHRAKSQKVSCSQSRLNNSLNIYHLNEMIAPIFTE